MMLHFYCSQFSHVSYLLLLSPCQVSAETKDARLRCAALPLLLGHLPYHHRYPPAPHLDLFLQVPRIKAINFAQRCNWPDSIQRGLHIVFNCLCMKKRLNKPLQRVTQWNLLPR